MKKVQILSLAVLGVVSAGALEGAAHAQALPPGVEAEGAVAKKPPFGGLGLDINAWNQTGLWGGGGAYRNDFGFLFIPSWSIGRRMIGKGPFRSLSLQARFFFNAPVAGLDESNFTGDAPPWSEQQPCATSSTSSLSYRDLPRCPWGRGSRRVDYSDLTLILANPGIYKIPKIGVRLDPSLLVTLPTSAQSRLATLALQATAQIGVSRSVWKDRLNFAYTFGYGMPFFRYTTGGVYYDNRGVAAGFDQDQLSQGLSNFSVQFAANGTLVPATASVLCRPGERCRNPTLFTQHTFRGTLSILDSLSLTVIYRISNIYTRNPAECAETVAFDYAPPTVTCGTGNIQSPTGFWIDNQLLWAMVNYQALPWLGLSLSYIVGAPFWTYARSTPTDPMSAAVGDGQPTRTYRQALYSFDANDFSSVSLGVDVAIEALASKLLKKK